MKRSFSLGILVAQFWLPLIVWSAAACSGLTSPSSDSGAPPAGFARFSGAVLDPTGAPIVGATVSVPFGTGQSFSGTTDSKGSYDFIALASDFAGVSPVAMVVYKDRYLPRVFYYTSVSDGASLVLSSGTANAVRPLTADEWVPSGAQFIFHVGDGDFGGSANSQLQTALSGSGLQFPMTTWTAAMASTYHSATLQFVARGVQTSLCPTNMVGLYTASGIYSYVKPSDSDASGNFSAYAVTVPVTGFPVNGQVSFAVKAGPCSAGDLDDWEFGGVLVTLNR